MSFQTSWSVAVLPVAAMAWLVSVAGEPLVTVIVSRHGIRTPYSPDGVGNLTKEAFEKYTNEPFTPCWPPGPQTSDIWGTSVTAALTPHGAHQIRHMGAWMGQHNFSHVECSDIALYSDVTSARDNNTGTNWTIGAFPKCSHLHADAGIIGAEGAKQLFNSGNDQSLCEFPGESVINSFLGGTKNGYEALRHAYSVQMELVDSVVKCCPASLCGGKEPCNMSSLPITYNGKFWSASTGGFYQAQYWADFFLLEYMNGNKNFALGKLTGDEVVNLYRMGVENIQFMDNAISASSFASTLASHMLASLVQAHSGQQISGLAHGPTAKVVYMAAHDTNLVFLRQLLGLYWQNLGWAANAVPPGGMLIFELEDVPGNGPMVSAYFQAASPSQLRNNHSFTDQDPPSRIPVAIPGCTEGAGLACSLADFQMAVVSKLRTKCIGNAELQKFIDDIHDKDKKDDDWPARCWWVFVLIVVVAFVAGIAVSRIISYRASQMSRDPNSQELMSHS